MVRNNRQQMYNERFKRIHDAISLKEPDRIPIIAPGTISFPYFDAGYTLADIIYDIEKAKDAIRKYLVKYEPDSGHTFVAEKGGMGKILEKEQNKNHCWAGMPGNKIDKNSIHQFIEYMVLLDDEFIEFNHNRTQWNYSKCLPRLFGLCEPMKYIEPLSDFMTYKELASFLARPEIKKMIDDLIDLNTMWGDYNAHLNSFTDEVESMGFPVMMAGLVFNPFDTYSDSLRGTVNGCTDLYDYPDEVYGFVTTETERVVERIKNGPIQPGKNIFIPMHKGMDGYLSDAQYEKYYFCPLLKIVEAIISTGMVPHLYTEGKYSTRVKFLKQLPKGKTIVHFEEMDMKIAKKELGDVTCLSGAYPSLLLENGSVKDVVEEAKRLIDILAPGGGYIFDLSCDMYNCKSENVEALFETIKSYGKSK